jgi:hypothetical protein
VLLMLVLVPPAVLLSPPRWLPLVDVPRGSLLLLLLLLLRLLLLLLGGLGYP